MKRTFWTTVIAASALAAVTAGTLLGQLGMGPARRADDANDANARPWPKKLVNVNVKAKTVSFPAEICGRVGMDGGPMDLELLLTSWKGKTHESILRTPAKGWQIHAGLVMLGLPRGRVAQTSYSIDTQEYTSQPPRGPKVKLSVSWTGKDGKKHTADPASWMQKTDPNSAIKPPSEYVFIGSVLGSEGGYAADAQGEYISLVNFNAAILDVPFISTDSDASLYFRTKPDAIPPEGTRVTVTIHVLKDAAESDFVRRLLYVDRFGRYRAEGSREMLRLDQLSKWGESFVGKHKRGEVILRGAGKAFVHDLLVAREELWIGGVREIDVQYEAARTPVLPRTPEQMKQALTDWAAKFAQPSEQIDPPLETVVPTLQQIDQKLHEMKVTRKMLEEYRTKLRAMASKAKSSGTGEADE
ncbi:MAG: YdjY domain-containing protein [Phycisphaerae bacterium]